MKTLLRITASSAIAASMMSPSFAADHELSLMLDWFVNPNHGPIVIAHEKGYFAEQGLEVAIQEPADPSMPPKLVAAGKVDMAISYQPTLTIDVAAGLPLIRSGTLVSTPLNTLIVLDESGIKSPADLSGKKIGISIAGTEEATVGTMLKYHGLEYGNVEMINVGWSLAASLASGKVDAVWGGLRNFETNQLELENVQATAFYPEEHGVPSYDELIFVANSKSYDKEAIKAFNSAIEKATTYIVNHPDAAWEEFVSYSPDTLDNELNAMAWEDSLTRFALRPAAVDLARYDHYAQFMFDHGIIKTLPKAADYNPIIN
ncbi:Putative thiamine biosynthesis protein [Marinomonas gallaica]|uniref:Thiamine biosynthesis protein n=1 Tax=Marinomonas gallaica TaxID=1806667 RepID=A0A1C3JRZ4_9GAMM|nr:ABC transporter substrate-binding protein [Marinomonas gallaica]SBT17983.1 Putative thiamine biosynthesis protein [Marinomonas gallaica]SBT20718.1 Putative thiamine biosynthesis protein [Marinomonas gallaica]